MRILLCLTIVISSGTIGHAQQPRKFDMYGNLAWSDEKPRLDLVAIQLDQLKHDSADFVAYFVVYGGRFGCVGEARARALRIKNYLVHRWGIEPTRVMWSDGGYREEFVAEVWILPRAVGNPGSYSLVDRKDLHLKNCAREQRRHINRSRA